MLLLALLLPLRPAPSRCAPPLLSEEPPFPRPPSSPHWRITRARLTADYSAEVRRRKVRFLPFKSARQWARAMHLCKESEWREWIDAGEKRNPYVPSNPEVVYAATGWAGWDDFLNGPIEDLSTILDPKYKRGKWLRGPLADISSHEKYE
ncbi:MAG: hypothetical protein SGPRY_002325 [Prymnesium sp.]